MKLLVKTLTGGKFDVQVEESNTVAEVKTVIETAKPDLPAASMKLIKSGKVLKDEDVLSAIGVKENDFLVVMVAKPKKAAAPAPAATPKASTPAAAAPAAAEPSAASSSTATPAAASATTSATTTPAPTTSTSATPAAPAAPSSDFPAEVVGNLTAMGFPEEEVRHCLRAAQGNPDMAVEFLTTGIPEGINLGSSGSSSAPTPAGSSSSSQPLQALRNHPQFNDLRRLVQSNPQMLQSVLSQIGQQQPQLLQEINDNQALFLQMMNEPINESSSGSPAADASGSSSSSGGGSGSPGGLGGTLGGLGNPAQMAQMINSMSAEELQQMSTMMGLSPEQLRATAQMIGQMPPEQLQQFMMQAMGSSGLSGAGGGGGGAGAPQVLRLTDEEMAAVDRLTEMGFDRAEAAQAFLACDKNEALAANLLMDSMGEEGGFFGGAGGGSGNNDNNDGSNNDNSGGDNDEDMYD